MAAPARADREAIDHAIESVALTPQRRKRLTDLSGGQQQRALIAKALVAEPQLLVLDEPIAGVDVESQRLFRDSLVHLVREHDTAILLVSHELGAVADDLDHVIVLKKRVVFDGTPTELAATGVSLGVHKEDLPLWLEEAGLMLPGMPWPLPWPFDRGYMQLALVAGVMVGATAPLIGVFIVQKGMSLMGDGIGHVAVAGVGASLLMGTSPTWTALVVAVAAALLIEFLRSRGNATGDLALALVFYGGIAAGVVLASRSATNTNLQPYLFGSILTATGGRRLDHRRPRARHRDRDGVRRAGAARGGARRRLRRVAGIPARSLNAVLAVLTAVTVVAAMRIVGVLLVAALMVLPVATSRLLARSFRTTVRLAVACGVVSAVLGLVAARQWALAAGGAIVLVATALFAVASIVAGARRAGRPGRLPPRRPPLTPAPNRGRRRGGSLAFPEWRASSRASSRASCPACSCGAIRSASRSSPSTPCTPATRWWCRWPRSTTGSTSSPTLAAHLFTVAQTIGRAQQAALSPRRIGVMIAGDEVPHTHLHVVPFDSVAELSFAHADPDPPAGSLDAAATAIRVALRDLGAEHVVD